MRNPDAVDGDWRGQLHHAWDQASGALLRLWQCDAERGQPAKRALVFDAPDRRPLPQEQAIWIPGGGVMRLALIRKG